MKFLVYGATGTQGGAVARRALASGHQVRALVRDPARGADLAKLGAELVIGDLHDANAVDQASHGVDGIFVLAPVSEPPEAQQAGLAQALEASVRAKVAQVVITTSGVVPAKPSGAYLLDAKRDLVALAQRLRPDAVILKPRFYLENLAGPWTRPAIESEGIIAYPLPAEHPFAWISADDAAAFSVAALERRTLAGQHYDIAGERTYRGADLAAAFGTVLRRPIRYVPIDTAEFGRALAKVFGEQAGAAVGAGYAWEGAAGADECGADGLVARNALGVVPESLEGWVQRTFVAGKS